MEIDFQATIRPEERVLFRELDGEAILLNLEDGQYYGLDEMGTRIWQLLERHRRLEPAFEALIGEFEVPAERLRADLARFVAELASCRLLILEEPAP